MELTYNNNIHIKICSSVTNEVKGIDTEIDYLHQFDSIENILRLQVRESVMRKYNLEDKT